MSSAVNLGTREASLVHNVALPASNPADIEVIQPNNRTKQKAINVKACVLALGLHFATLISLICRHKEKIKLTVDLVTSDTGLKKLSESAHKLKDFLVANEPGNESRNALTLLEMFDNWAQDLCPSLDREEFFEKLEKMSKANKVQVRTTTSFGNVSGN